MFVGAIEAGGTKFVCAIGNENSEIIESITFPTTTPSETIPKIFELFDKYPLESIGIGSFGPIDINKQSDTYGYILSTPKLEWENIDFVGAIKKRYNVPIGWTTDVNAAVLGETIFGAGKNKSNVLYITVGTGIGVGVLNNGKLLEGIGHPEMGHVAINIHPEDDFTGDCPYHAFCLEGMTSGRAIMKRTGTSGAVIKEDSEIWPLVADYIGQALVTYTVTLRPEKIILGGGVMNVSNLLGKIKKEFETKFSDYLPIPQIDDYIVSPGLKGDSGIIGALYLGNKMINTDLRNVKI